MSVGSRGGPKNWNGSFALIERTACSNPVGLSSHRRFTLIASDNWWRSLVADALDAGDLQGGSAAHRKGRSYRTRRCDDAAHARVAGASGRANPARFGVGILTESTGFRST